MDDWWESEYGENGETCADNLFGYQPQSLIDSDVGIYTINCLHCQIRHRCKVGIMVLLEPLKEAVIIKAYDETLGERKVV